MKNPLVIHYSETAIIQKDVMDQPDFCNYPIRGLPWTTVRDVGYSMSLQESEFFGGHMLLMEHEAFEETEIMFSAPEPVVFTVVMIEGFFRFFQEEKLLSYAMGGSYYMTYNPSITARLKASAGKHLILVFALDRESLGLAERTYPPMEILMECIRHRSPHTVRLPVCRMTREVIDLWSCIRKLSPNIHVRSSDISSVVSRLIRIYQLQLKQGNVVKEQLSMDIANALIMYVDAHYTSDRDVRKAEIAQRIGEPVSMIEGYCQVAFGRSLHKHIRDMRMGTVVRLLVNTDMSIRTIIASVGYSHGSNFFRLFLIYFGLSPSEYRRKNR